MHQETIIRSLAKAFFIPTTMNFPQQVQFESLFGTAGDIHMAIDDVDIKAGMCDKPGAFAYISNILVRAL